MADATITTDLTLISDCESTTNWDSPSQLGSEMSLALESDIVKAGSGAVFISNMGTGVKGMRFNFSIARNFTTEKLYMWIWVVASNFVNTLANGGVRIYAEDGSGNYGFWYIGGSDTPWVGGGYRRIAIDLTRTPDANGGTDPTISNITYVGAACDFVATSLKAPTLIIDQVHRGTRMSVSGGSADDPITFSDILRADTGGDYLGFVDVNRGEQFELLSNLVIGDPTGEGFTYFESKNESLVWADNPLAADDVDNVLSVDEFTGTSFKFGDSVGDLNDEVGFDGSTMYAAQNIFGLGYKLDFTGDVSGLAVYGSTFLDATGGIELLGTGLGNTGHYWKSNVISTCGQIVPGEATLRGSQFNRTIDDTGDNSGDGAALLWNTGIDIQDCSFFANTKTGDGVDPHAIEHDLSGTYTYTNLKFAGNDFDILYTGAGNLTISATAGSDPTTGEMTQGGVLTIDNPITVTFTQLEASPPTEVRVYQADTTNEIAGEENITDGDFAFSAQAAQLLDIRIHNIGFETIEFYDFEVPGADTVIPLQQQTDRQYENP